MGKNLGAIGNILGTAFGNTLGTKEKTQKNPCPPPLLKNSYKKTTPFLAKRKWLG